jgi:Secretion system C-terminal sorting domain
MVSFFALHLRCINLKLFDMKSFSTIFISMLVSATLLFSNSAFAQGLANDENTGAIALTPSINCTPTSGTTLNATASAVPVCTGSAEDDVWYTFIATATSLNITVVGIATFDPVIEVFLGNLSNLTSINCTNVTAAGGTETVCVNGLTVGVSYWVRVYDFQPFPQPVPNFTICITNCNGVGVEQLTVNNFSISPNPCTSQTVISFSEEQKHTTIKVTNLLGECLLQSSSLRGGKEQILDLSGLAKGIYFVKIEDENKNIVIEKLILQ